MPQAGNIIELASELGVDAAWDSYVEMARDLVDDPRLLTDREFNQEFTRRHERWRKLFLMQEAPR